MTQFDIAQSLELPGVRVGLGVIAVGLFYVFAAFLAWELGGLPADVLGRLHVTRWAFAGMFAAITAVRRCAPSVPEFSFASTHVAGPGLGAARQASRQARSS